MGTSNWQNISWCVQAIMKIQPRRVLDVGVGFGRWGMVVREFAEVWFDRVLPEDWTIEIEGIEAFAKNIAPYHAHFYNRIHIGDAKDLVPQLPGRWNLVILGDVLEHFYKSDGERLLATLLERSDYVLVNLPLGDSWEQHEKYDNPYEEHKATWELEDFPAELVRAHKTFLDFAERPFASVLLSHEDPQKVQHSLFGSPRQGELGTPAPATVDLELMREMRERLAALDHVRASGSWRLVNRVRTHPLLWRAAGLLRRNRGDRFELEFLGGPDGAKAEPLVVMRLESDGTPIVWEMIGRRGQWELRPNAEAAFGEALVAPERGAKLCWYGYGAAIRLQLLGGPDAGACRLRVGRQRFELPLVRSVPTRLLVDANAGKVSSEQPLVDAPAPALPKPRTAKLLPEHEALLETIRGGAKSLAVYVPEWRGIRSATTILFDATHPLPAQLDGPTRDSFLLLVREAGLENLVFSGGAVDHLTLCREIHDRVPGTRLKVLWHGSTLQVREDYAWTGMRLIFELGRRKILHSVGFVKEGMAELAREAGVAAHFVMNYVPKLPAQASRHAADGPHFGLWLSNEGWRKPPYAMAAAARAIPGANLHYAGERPRLVEYARQIGLRLQRHGADLLGPEELRKWMRLMHLNLYVTLSECCPMLPLESLAEGVPCLIGPNSHLFRDDRYLFDRLVVPFPDSEAAIAEKIQQALVEREQIVAAYVDWAREYNERARASVTAFLEA